MPLYILGKQLLVERVMPPKLSVVLTVPQGECTVRRASAVVGAACP